MPRGLNKGGLTAANNANICLLAFTIFRSIVFILNMKNSVYDALVIAATLNYLRVI